MKTHTSQAYRALYRPHESYHTGVNEEDYAAAVGDMVEEILSGELDAFAMDTDGTPLLSLLLRHWPSDSSMKSGEIPASHPPLPGTTLALNRQHLGPRWQWPAQAAIWKGVSPFQNWPSNGLGWGPSLPEARCPLLVAFQCHAWAVVRQGLAHPDCPPSQELDRLRVGQGMPLLHWAIRHPLAVRLLLEAGLDPNVRDANGRTALFETGNVEVVKLLLAHGADPLAMDDLGATAASHWGNHLTSPKELLKALNDHGVAQATDGKSVVSACRSNSWKTVETALNGSRWDPLTPVEPGNPQSLRLLPEACVQMLKTMNGPSALPCRPVIELLSRKPFASAWTVEEKAWAAGAFALVRGLKENMRWALTNDSYTKAMEQYDRLREDPEVEASIAEIFPALMGRVQETNPYIEESIWKGWVLSLPYGKSEKGKVRNHGWETLGLLISQPFRRKANLVSEGDFGPVFLKARSAFSSLSPEALLGLLMLRSASKREGPVVLNADEAWRKAWEALPEHRVFPVKEDWVEKILLATLGGPERRTWHEWMLTHNLRSQPTQSRRLPRM